MASKQEIFDYLNRLSNEAGDYHLNKESSLYDAVCAIRDIRPTLPDSEIAVARFESCEKELLFLQHRGMWGSDWTQDFTARNEDKYIEFLDQPEFHEFSVKYVDEVSISTAGPRISSYPSSTQGGSIFTQDQAAAGKSSQEIMELLDKIPGVSSVEECVILDSSKAGLQIGFESQQDFSNFIERVDISVGLGEGVGLGPCGLDEAGLCCQQFDKEVMLANEGLCDLIEILGNSQAPSPGA
jgi:hypothetical protein